MRKHKAFAGSAPWTIGIRIIAVAILIAVVIVIAGRVG